MAEKVGELQGLFEFLEKDLDAPAAAVEIGDGLRAPTHVVGQEDHFPQFPVPVTFNLSQLAVVRFNDMIVCVRFYMVQASMKLSLLSLVIFVSATGVLPAVGAESAPLYQDASQPLETRVEDLLSRMTLGEKVSQVHADSKFSTAAVPQLGIPRRWIADGPHGVREDVGPYSWNSAGRTDDYATWLPVLSALGSTWKTGTGGGLR